MKGFWLVGGALFCGGYLGAAWLLGESPAPVRHLLDLALLLPPATAATVITMRRRRWSGCQRLFWTTIALGASISALGQAGWVVDGLMSNWADAWMGWRAVLGLLGFIAPLVALLCQPHRGPRLGAVPPIAVDIAGVTVLLGFLYAYFVSAPSLLPGLDDIARLWLFWFSILQQLLVTVALAFAVAGARTAEWNATYRRLAIGSAVTLAALGVGGYAAWRSAYTPGSAYDLIWIVPFVFYGWAAVESPSSPEVTTQTLDAAAPQPWLLFGILGLVPLFGYVARYAYPFGPPVDDFRDLSTTMTVISVLALFTARIALESTELERAGARLKLLAGALEQTHDLVLIRGTGGDLEYANDAFCHSLGYTPEELRVIAPQRLVSEDSWGEFLRVEREVHTHGISSGVFTRVRKDGMMFPVACSLMALRDDAGRVTHIVGVERDMTDELRLRDQLVQSERLSAVGQFVAGVAHEINNPLQAILSCTELLLEHDQPPAVRTDLELMRSEAARAGQIIRNLLGFARRGSTERRAEDLSDIVEQTTRLRAYHMGSKGVTLDLQMGRDLPPVSVSRDEIQQVVANLLLNAEQAILDGPGHGCITVRTWHVDGQVALDVSDDGPGIPATLRSKIFEPFFTTKEVGQGTGLGLSVSLGVARAHGGTLDLVASERGAHFRLTLPVVAGQPVLEVPPAPAPALQEGAERRALVVDDEPFVRSLLERLLQRRGYVVDLAPDGRAATSLVEAQHYDVVLCDIRMPNLSGPEFYRYVSQRHPHLQRAFVFITGDVGAVTTRAGMPEDALVLAKPFTPQELEAILRRVEA